VLGQNCHAWIGRNGTASVYNMLMVLCYQTKERNPLPEIPAFLLCIIIIIIIIIISENLDSVFKQYIRKWLEVPISGSLSNIYLTSNKFGLNIIPPSTKFIQCQTTHPQCFEVIS
jgi:hypothetical protein